MPQETKTFPRAFAFVLTPITLLGFIQCEIVKDHLLKRASPTQVAQIKDFLARMAGSLSFEQYYEFSFQQDAIGRTQKSCRLPPDQWNYYIVECASGRVMDELAVAMALLDTEIELGFEMGYDPCLGATSKWRPGVMPSYFDSLISAPSLVGVTKETLEGVADILKAVQRHELIKSPISTILQRFQMLKRLPRNDPFYILAQFTLLEALVTHNPSRNGDGLKRQMKSKMSLLSKRFQTPLDASSFGPSVTMQELWETLYTYRSCIAHGSLPDFAGRELKILVNESKVLEFVKLAVKRLLIFTMDNHELVADLRDC